MKSSINSNIYGKYSKPSFLMKNPKDKKFLAKKPKEKKVAKVVRHTFLCGGKLISDQIHG